MKIRLLFFPIIFFVLFVSNLDAQDGMKFHKGFHLHLKNAFYQYGDESLAIRKSALNYSFGYHMTFDFKSKVGIRIGGRFSGMKVSQFHSYFLAPCNVTTTGDFDYSTYRIEHHRLFYIGIPLDIKVKLNGGKNHLYLIAGGEVLFNLNDGGHETIIECGDINTSRNYSYINDAAVSEFLFKINGGIGAEMEVSKKMKVFFEPQFEYTVVDLLSNPVSNSSTNFDNVVKAIEIGMMVGIKF